MGLSPKRAILGNYYYYYYYYYYLFFLLYKTLSILIYRMEFLNVILHIHVIINEEASGRGPIDRHLSAQNKVWAHVMALLLKII